MSFAIILLKFKIALFPNKHKAKMFKWKRPLINPFS